MDFFYETKEFFKSVFQWWVIIAPWEQAVRVRLGKTVTPIGCGVCIKIPFIDRIYKQPIRLRTLSVPNQSLMTSDKKLVILSGSLSYKVVDLLKLYQTLHDPKGVIIQRVQGIVSKCVVATALEDLSPQGIMDVVNEELSLEQYGLCGSDFFLTGFAHVKALRVITGELSSGDNDYFTGIDTTSSVN